jgi:hypothetical protein
MQAHSVHWSFPQQLAIESLVAQEQVSSWVSSM